MDLKQKKNQDKQYTEQQINKYNKIIKDSNLHLLKFLNDLQTKQREHHETFYVFFLEKSDYAKQIDRGEYESNLQKTLSNYEMKNRSICKQPIRIQLLVNAIIKGSKGDSGLDKQYVFSQLFANFKNQHILDFIGEGFFEMYYISIYSCKVTENILDHLLKKGSYVDKESETVMIFKNESLNLKQDTFQDFFLPQEDNFKYYSVSDYLKKATQKLWTKAEWLLENHDNTKKVNQGQYYDNIFGDLQDNITPDLTEKLEYDRKCQENPRYKLEYCNYYKTNSCVHKMNSVKCKFAHGEIELLTPNEGNNQNSTNSNLSNINSSDISENNKQYNNENSDYNNSNHYEEEIQYNNKIQQQQNNQQQIQSAKQSKQNKKHNEKTTDKGQTNSDSFFESSSQEFLDSDDEQFQSHDDDDSNNKVVYKSTEDDSKNKKKSEDKAEYDISIFCQA